MANVAVIGAGMAGMATAARLATRGHSVTVFEAAQAPGGKNRGLHQEGFGFDLGPSTLTLPAVYRDLFRKTGKPLEDSVDLLAVDPAFAYHFPDGSSLSLPGVGVGAAAHAMQSAFGADSGERWLRLMGRAAEIWRLTRRDILGRSRPSPADLTRLMASPHAVRAVAPWRTMRSMGKHYLRDPRQRMILDRYATYAGSDPRKAPGALITIPYVEQAFGVWHIRGGVSALTTALFERCEQCSVDFRFAEAVTGISTREGRVVGVTTATGDFACDAVVANCDDAVLRDLLPTTTRAPRLDPSFSGFVIAAAVTGTTPGVHHHNVWFPEDYDAEFDGLFGGTRTPVADPTIYACVPQDPSMSPAGHEAWFILINAARHDPGAGVDWSAHPGYADHILDVLARRGVDLRPRLLWMRTVTPSDLAAATFSPGGSIYGPSNNSRIATVLRPGNLTKYQGLFHVGGSAHPGGGLPLVGMGAETVADLAAAYLRG